MELDRGHGIPWEGNYSSWLEQKKDRLAKEEKAASARQKTLEKELEWVRMSPKARQSKSKARLAAYEKLAAEEAQNREEELEIRIPAGKHLGDLVIEAVNVSKGLWRSAADRQSEFPPARGGRHWRDRPERRRQDDPLPHVHGRGASR